MRWLVSARLPLAFLALVGLGLSTGRVHAQQDPNELTDTPGAADTAKQAPQTASSNSIAIKKVSIRAPRDIGYFQGDLVKADVEIFVDGAYKIVPSSLPQPGPVNYWLDLQKVDIERHGSSASGHYTLSLLYQDFYDALDARQQEIPSFPVEFTNGKDTVVAHVPAWTIGVSPLREIAPPPKEDPKDYLRPNEPATFMHADPLWTASAAFGVATILALLLLAYDRLWWPFHSRPTRVFAETQRKMQALAKNPDSADSYVEALLLVHRGIDRTDGNRVLADDMPQFLSRHPAFAVQRDGFAKFFAASRAAFFGSDPAQARAALGLGDLLGFTRSLAAIERSQP